MIPRKDIQKIVKGYDPQNIHIGMTASHSALDVCDGAAEEGLPTLAVCQKGREKTYSHYGAWWTRPWSWTSTTM